MASSTDMGAMPMESEVDHHNPDGLSSDIGGFLSNSCMETDEKGDPFSSDSALGFPGDSSRFDSDCILNSSLSESMPVQHMSTGCDSTVSYLSGESPVSSSILGGAPLRLFDVVSSSEQKPTNPVTQFSSSNFISVGELESKVNCVGAAVGDPSVQYLSPVQFLTPMSQSHPVVIGNTSAAAFVKSVLKDAPAVPSSSANTFTGTKEPISISLPPGVVLLSSGMLPSLNLMQPAAGLSSAPLLIQLPPAFAGNPPPGHQQPGCNLNSLASSSSMMIGSSLNEKGNTCPSASNSSSSEVLTPNATLVSSSALVSTPAVAPTTILASSSCQAATDIPKQETSTVRMNSSDDSVTKSNPSVFQGGQNAGSKPIVISCAHPNSAGNKSMQQILEHFFQQNRKTVENPAVHACEESDKPQLKGCAESSNPNDSDFGLQSTGNDFSKAQIISLTELQNTEEVSTFTLPSLGGKSNSVVFVLRRNVTQTGEQRQNASSESKMNISSSSCGNTNSLPVHCINSGGNTSQLQTGLGTSTASVGSASQQCGGNQSTSNAEEDEVDGSSATTSSTSFPIHNSNSVPSVVSQDDIMSPSGQMDTDSSELNLGNSVTVQTNNITDAYAQHGAHWMQIQLPGNLGEGNPDTKDIDDIQKLVPLTVSEKLTSDVCRPIIICIVQEDGVTKQVNINPVEVDQAAETDNSNKTDLLSPQSTSSDQCDENVVVTIQDTPNGPPPSAEPANAETDNVSKMPQDKSVDPPATSSYSGRKLRQRQVQIGGQSATRLPATTQVSPDDEKFKCDLCTAVFTRLGNYTRHRKIHTLNLKEDKHFKCPYCQRPFLQRCDMKRHMAIHTNEHPFHCQTCGKGYIRKSDLVVHERFHSKDRAFKCEICGRCFYQSGDLHRHKRFVHSEQANLLWSCGHCHRKYAREVTLIRHMKTTHNDILLQSLSTAENDERGETSTS